jgi:hypothetical protein
MNRVSSRQPMSRPPRKGGLSCARNLTGAEPRSAFIAQSSSRSAEMFPCATSPRSAPISPVTRSTKRRRATNGATKPIPPLAISRGSCGAASPAVAGRTV